MEQCFGVLSSFVTLTDLFLISLFLTLPNLFLRVSDNL